MAEHRSHQVLMEWLMKTQGSGAGKAWIKSVRLKKNLQGHELSQKMRVSPARISVLEKDEQRGAVTLRMMQKAAAALDCSFVYAFVPKLPRPGTKPRIRLDSASMAAGKPEQQQDLERQYRRSQLKTKQE